VQEPLAATHGPPPRAQDFLLSSFPVNLERVYKIRFALTAPDGNEIPRYWSGFFDASPRKIVPMVGLNKRKFTPEEGDEEDY
jgi:hypothetical protein